MPENYILLERIELNTTAASVTFNNIPQSGYTDLKVVFSTRNTGSVSGVRLGINGSNANFSNRYIEGNGSSVASGTLNQYIGAETPSSATASTFGNGEFYIPNYTGSNFKSISADSVTENNNTTAYTDFNALLWSQTAAITSLNIFVGGGAFDIGSTFSLYGIAALGTTPVIAPKAIGGNIIDFDGTNWIHTFTSSGTFTPLQGLTCDYLVVAGGGSGGGNNTANGSAGGGGGGGGYLSGTGFSVSATPYTVTVGGGGAGSQTGTAGNNSVFASITSTGGGFGGTFAVPTGASLNGGSGGGGAGRNATETNTGGTASSGEGSNGGTGFSGSGNAISGAGGGGKNAVGNNGANQSGGAGGAGLASSITGTSVTRSGGGGGGSSYHPNFPSPVGGAGGSGGGGAGASGTSGSGVNGSNGTTNTGGGGGGGADNAQAGGAFSGGAGGSGIVIIRYPAA
jgi:hypothetical protein